MSKITIRTNLEFKETSQILIDLSKRLNNGGYPCVLRDENGNILAFIDYDKD